jgi:hypothetical protein
MAKPLPLMEVARQSDQPVDDITYRAASRYNTEIRVLALEITNERKKTDY